MYHTNTHFQILSIAKALPLQIHPNKDLAAKLHAQDPSQFTDPNHKPEIAIALSKFEVFAGFKPLSQIQPLFTLPSLAPYVPQNTTTWTNATLRETTRALLKASPAEVEDLESALLATPPSQLSSLGAAHITALLPRLQRQYGPNDAGSLVALTTMNFLTLEPLDALYIPADGIHAYLSGNIVECMARSNNVLNAGFCAAADRNNVNLFADALTFSAQSVEDVTLRSEVSERGTERRARVYRPPVGEFDVLVLGLAAGEREVVRRGEGPGVVVVTQGTGRMVAEGREWEVKEGAIWFVAPEVEVEFGTESGMQVFEAVV